MFLDTDVCVDYLRRAPQTDHIARMVEGRLQGFCSVVTQTELLASVRHDRDEQEVAALLSVVTIVGLTQREAVWAGRYLNSFRQRTGLRLGDALIAASAVSAGLPLLTRNLRHFRDIPGLTLVSVD